MTLEVISRALAELTPAAYNPRQPLAPQARAKLRASLLAFGLVVPLIWNRRTNRLVGGHARLELLRELGHTEAPVSVVDLSEPEEKALNVILNNREAQGRFDPVKLSELLGELAPLAEFPLTGFAPSDLANLKLEPLPAEPALPDVTSIEVMLTFTEAEYAAASETLNRWTQDGIGVRVIRS